MNTKITAALRELGLPTFAGPINQMFLDLVIADDEIKAAQERHPESAAALWDAFPLLCRPATLAGKAEKLYAAHCRELLDRVAKGDDIDAATRAEVAAALCEMTLKSRLIPDAEHLYLRLFLELGLDLPGEDSETTLAQARAQFTWSTEGQNRVFSQIIRKLDTKRAR